MDTFTFTIIVMSAFACISMRMELTAARKEIQRGKNS